jgi:hypothetical protein
MHLFEFIVYCKVQSCTITHELWKMLFNTNETKVAMTKTYLIRCLYNFQVKGIKFGHGSPKRIRRHNYQLSTQGMRKTKSSITYE